MTATLAFPPAATAVPPCPCGPLPPSPELMRELHEPWVATPGWEVVAALVLVTLATTGWIVHRSRRGAPAGSIVFGVAGMTALAAANVAIGLFILQTDLVTLPAAALTTALCSAAWLVAWRHRPDTGPAGAADRSEQAASGGAGDPAPTPDTIHPTRKADLS